MVSKYRYILTALGIAVAIFTLYGFSTEKIQPKTIAIAKPKQSYFCPIPLKISSDHLPCVETTIDGESFLMVLDLGLQGGFSLLGKHCDKILGKKLVRTRKMCNFTGNGHLVSCYRVREASIQAASWREPIVQECSEEYEQEQRIFDDEHNYFDDSDGAIGWLLFREMNLFFDLGNGKAAICDGLNTLRERGYCVESWVQKPLLIDRGFIECEATTPDGVIRCVLDTGSTWNLLNREIPGKSKAEACFDPGNFVEYSTFKIGEVDLGPITLRQIPLKYPFPVSIVLGMDFFFKHQVFIDFVEGNLYFSPSIERTTSTPL